jgi:hypothetical protein
MCGVKKEGKKNKKGRGVYLYGGEKVRGKRKKKNMGLEKKKKSFICLLSPKCRIVKIC